jgi:nitrate reductase gamma subunit
MVTTIDFILYAAFPYVAIVVALAATAYRFISNRYSVSSLSSQFLEGRRLFWGSAPFHYGILIVLAGHLIAFLFPRSVLWFNGVPARLYILEATGLAFGLLAVFGLLALVYRRAATPRIRAVTSPMDVVLLVMLLFQLASGVYIAVFHRWGSSWFAQTATPYLWSIFKLAPDPQGVAALPLAARLHILSAWGLLAVIPFTRLVHFLVIPIAYLWRPYQLVIWNRRAARERS